MDVTQVQKIISNPKNIGPITENPSSTSGVQPVTMLQLQLSQTYGNPGGGSTTNPGGYETLYRRNKVEQVFNFASGGTVLPFAHVVPVGANIVDVQLNFDTPITLATATNVGVGTNQTTGLGNLLTTGTIMTKNIGTGTTAGQNNMKIIPVPSTLTQVPSNTAGTGATFYVGSTNSGGTQAGTMVGTVRGVLVYDIFENLAPHP